MTDQSQLLADLQHAARTAAVLLRDAAEAAESGRRLDPATLRTSAGALDEIADRADAPADAEPESLPAADTCQRCHVEFTETDTRWDGLARYEGAPFCRRCVDRCHESTEFDHQCRVCEHMGA